MKTMNIAITLLCFSAYGNSHAVRLNDWHEVSTRHFTVVTDSKVKEARQLAEDLEKLRLVVGLFSNTQLSDHEHLKIYLAKNDDTYNTLVGVNKAQSSTGVHVASRYGQMVIVNRRGNWMATPGVSRIDWLRRFVFHEYIHHFHATYSRINFPYWFSEGLSEYYSTVRFLSKNRVTLGEQADWRVKHVPRLSEDRLRFLLEVNRAMGIDDEKIRFVYSGGWGLTHYLLSNSARSRKLDKYLLDSKKLIEPVMTFERHFEQSISEFVENYNNDARANNFHSYTIEFPGGFDIPVAKVENLTPDQAKLEILSAIIMTINPTRDDLLEKIGKMNKSITQSEKSLVLTLHHLSKKEYGLARTEFEMVSSDDLNTRWGLTALSNIALSHLADYEPASRDKESIRNNIYKIFEKLILEYPEASNYWLGLAKTARILGSKDLIYMDYCDRALMAYPRDYDVIEFCLFEYKENKLVGRFTRAVELVLASASSPDIYNYVCGFILYNGAECTGFAYIEE